MKTPTSATNLSSNGVAMPLMDGFRYKTIAIYPKFADVVGAMALLKKEGFTHDQISLLGREQEHWQEELKQEWNALDTTKGTLAGAALGSLPGLALITGITLTGGAGVLVAGPMIAGMAALGLGALGGSVMGAYTSKNNDHFKILDDEEEIKSAISQGYWVIVAHSHDEAEANRAQALLPNSHTVLENETNEP